MDLKIILNEQSNRVKVFTSLDDLIFYYHEDVEFIKKFEEEKSKFYCAQFVYKDKSFKINWRLIKSDERTHKLIPLLIIYMDHYGYDYHRAIFNEMMNEYGALKFKEIRASKINELVSDVTKREE